MTLIDRIFKLHQILQQRKTPISGKELEKKLECSRATRGRVIDYMRELSRRPNRLRPRRQRLLLRSKPSIASLRTTGSLVQRPGTPSPVRLPAFTSQRQPRHTANRNRPTANPAGKTPQPKPRRGKTGYQQNQNYQPSQPPRQRPNFPTHRRRIIQRKRLNIEYHARS